mgnify:CR=1 FL=1
MELQLFKDFKDSFGKTVADHKFKLSEISSHGIIFNIGQFLEECIRGNFTDYDGFGRFIYKYNGKEYELDARFSIDGDFVLIDDIDTTLGIFGFCSFCKIEKVIWFNR